MGVFVRFLESVFRQVGDAIGGKRVVPAVPAGRTVFIPAREPSDPGPAQQPGAQTEPLAFFIEYRDASGGLSARRVTVKQVIGIPPHMLLCYCHERRAPRHFRVDRIATIAHPETGEVLPLADLLPALSASGLAAIPMELKRAINALVFLMRCDGYEHPAEWEAVDQALASWVLRSGGDDAQYELACAMARQVAPDGDDFLLALRWFAKSEQNKAFAQWLRRSIAAVIDADGELSEEEIMWVSEVKPALDQIESLRWS